MNKKTKVIALLKRLEFELGNSLFLTQGDKFETVSQTRSGNHEVLSIRLNMETLAPSLCIDANIVYCWGAVLNYKESLKKDPSPKRLFFPTNCITDAMVKGLIDKDEQWNMFSAEILAHFKNDDDNASRSLADIEFAIFPIGVSNHFYVVVFNIKKRLTSMIILDNSDSGTYNSKYKGACELLKKFFSRFLQEHNH